MTKYKDLKQEEKEFVDFYQMKWVRIIGFLAFLGLGIWMLIDPTPPRHQSVERATVALFKELWSMPFGIILVSVGLIGVSYFMMQLIKLIVKCPDTFRTFHLKNYRKLKDGQIRQASMA